VPQRSQLARVLWQTLQAALSQGWTDQQVAQRLINKINRHVPIQEMNVGDSPSVQKEPNNHLSNTKKVLGERLFTRIEPAAKQNAGKVTGMILEMPVKAIKGLLADEAALQTKVYEALATLTRPKQDTWANVVRETKAPKPMAKSKGKGKQATESRAAQFAVQIRPLEWSNDCLMTPN
jgi:hypothetical protein